VFSSFLRHPSGWPWRQNVLAAADAIEHQLHMLPDGRNPAEVELRQRTAEAVLDHLGAARDAARLEERKRPGHQETPEPRKLAAFRHPFLDWWTGTSVEAAYLNLHEAEIALAQLLPGDPGSPADHGRDRPAAPGGRDRADPWQAGAPAPGRLPHCGQNGPGAQGPAARPDPRVPQHSPDRHRWADDPGGRVLPDRRLEAGRAATVLRATGDDPAARTACAGPGASRDGVPVGGGTADARDPDAPAARSRRRHARVLPGWSVMAARRRALGAELGEGVVEADPRVGAEAEPELAPGEGPCRRAGNS
jgi:hypothetical protein